MASTNSLNRKAAHLERLHELRHGFFVYMHTKTLDSSAQGGRLIDADWVEKPRVNPSLTVRPAHSQTPLLISRVIVAKTRAAVAGPISLLGASS